MSADNQSKSPAPGAVEGRNGVVVPRHTQRGAGYRTYEVHQRERVGESTDKIKPAHLISADYTKDPYPFAAILRENYPCYRNWLTNDYWISQYNDVTSIFADEANFETRSKAWYYGYLEGPERLGRDLRGEIPVLEAQAAAIDNNVEAIADRLTDELQANGQGDLASQFAARLPLELLTTALDIPEADRGEFAKQYWAMQLGKGWEPKAQVAGRQAIAWMKEYLAPLVKARQSNPGEDMLSAIANVEHDEGPITAGDAVATILEGDHETLHGGLANLWFLLLTHREQLNQAADDPRFLKIAWLETMRHSTPVVTAERFARHEVERFGKLLPEGALLKCSAAAANRDPRVFDDPDTFNINRTDLCHREARGQYRADGLCTGITFALGKPSIHPAVPEDRPRSIYAITRDSAVTASRILIEKLKDLHIADGANPELRSLRVGEMHTCWQLPVTFGS